uniref:Uncharacterized protein n=1 Tax=Thermofilum pendens TaxID=2269 RepID=A0A7C4B929_THEPE
MEATLEYLAIGVLIAVLIIAANQLISTSTGALEPVREEQLYTVAERVMDKILLTPGYPPDWGTNIMVNADNLQDLGLALYGTRSPYVVDPDKVMRLANLSTLPNPLLLNSTRFAELLHLTDYGFRFVMKPMIKVEISPTGVCYPVKAGICYPAEFDIRVYNHYGVGLPNARVTGIYVIVKVDPNPNNSLEGLLNKSAVLVVSALTDALGNCRLNFYSQLDSFFSPEGGAERQTKWYYPFLIVYAEWQGFTSVAGHAVSAQGGVPAEGYIIGNYVFLHKDIELVVVRGRGNRNAGAVQTKDALLQVLPEYQSLLNVTKVTWCRDASTGNFRDDDPLCNTAGRVLPSAKQWYLIGYVDYVEQLSSHVFIFAKYRGSPVAIVVSRVPDIEISSGGSVPANAVTVRRLAKIYEYPYIIELTVWRKVEGYP